MRTEKVTFPGALGGQIAGRVDLPESEPDAYAIFAACFTCGKDINAARRMGMALAERGIATLRFDFTGQGSSEGDFAETNFSTNVDDILCAADYLRSELAAPQILIGHSLGGAAVLASAGRIPEIKAVTTINAPADPAHVTKNFGHAIEDIRREGSATIELAGRPFTITKQFLDDLHEQCSDVAIHDLSEKGKALLILHAPTDTRVGVENAAAIFQAAKHPKSFISLDTADHLITKKHDADYVGAVVAAWAQRYVDEHGMAALTRGIKGEKGAVIVEETRRSGFQNAVAAGGHTLLADEPESYGGRDTGPSPYDYVLSGLGACTNMTVRMYAQRKKWPLTRVRTRLVHSKVHASDCAACETTDGKIDRIERQIILDGDLSAEQRAKLLEIADKCPVHRTLHSEIEVVTSEGSAG